ncbi:MAG: hypothetical protein ABW000_01830 [Actinoplanes sp.]
MTTDEVPGEVREAVRAAARMTAGYGGRLEDVYRRGRRRRRRQTGAAFAGVVVVLLGVGLLTVHRDTTPTPQVPLPTSAPVTPSASATSASPAPVTVAQRLFLHMAGGKYHSARTELAKLGNGLGIGELTPDGRIVVHEEVGADYWDWVVGLPDGRIVTFGPEDLTGTPRADGPDVSGLAQNLLVISPKGKVLKSWNVREQGKQTGLLGADSKNAYLIRKSGFYTFNLKTGTERLVLTAKAMGVDPMTLGYGGEARDDQVVFGRNTDGCYLRLADLRTGKVRDLGGVQARNCQAVELVRLSPDGKAVAVAIEGLIKIIRLADGAELKAEMIAGGYDRASTISYDFAWQDDRTLRVVRVPYGDETYDLKPYTITY